MSACRKQAEARAEAPRASALPPPQVLEELRRALRLACAGAGPSSLPTGVLRRASLVMWNGDPQAAGFAGLLDAYMAGAAERPRWLRDLIEAWLRDFGPDRFRLAEAGTRGAALLPRSQDRRLALWRDAHARYRLLDAAQGPAHVGVALLRGPEPVPEVLANTGMDDPLRSNGRFFRAAIDAMLRALPDALRGRDAAEAWRRAVSLLEAEHTVRDRYGREMRNTRLRFADKEGPTARACLLPWLQGPPGQAPREAVKAFLLRVLGDPRVRSERWAEAGEDATRLMRGWLASASLEAFFALISETNDDPQWRYRQAFWRACLKAMPPDEPAEVWVVLGPGMANRARAARDLSSHGRMQATGTTGEQAVLLMRFGQLVLSEWSNVGPVRAWDVSDRRCPELYRWDRDYSANELRALCLDFPRHPTRGTGGSVGGRGLRHDNPKDGLWQGCAAVLLQNKVGLRLQYRDYMPRNPR